EKAVDICDAKFGTIYQWDGAGVSILATHNTPPAYAEARKTSFQPPAGTPLDRMLTAKVAVQVADLSREAAYRDRRDPAMAAGVELGGIRTWLGVPMLKEGDVIGGFSAARLAAIPAGESPANRDAMGQRRGYCIHRR